jgi:hypothetical protein
MAETSDTDVAECPPEFSARVAGHIDAICLKHGMRPGDQVPFIDAGTERMCWCACGPQDGINPVATAAGDRLMSDLAVGDAVLAAGPALDWSPVPVRFSDGAVMSANPDALIRIKLAAEGGKTLTVVPDHTFLTPAGALVRARDLAIGDRLVLAAGGAAAIIACDHIPAYGGYVWRIATSDEAPDRLDAHLLNTGGVVSGDYAVQLFFDAFSGAAFAGRSRPPRERGLARVNRTTRLPETAALRPFRDFAGIEEGCAELGAFLGLAAPAPADAFLSMTQDPTYARNLIIARSAPAFLEALLDNPPHRSAPNRNAAERPAIELLAKAARSLWAWSRSGLRTVADETLHQRLAACAACPHHRAAPDRAIYQLATTIIGNGDGARQLCALCGCITPSKARMASESCPDTDPARPAFTRWGEPKA